MASPSRIPLNGKTGGSSRFKQLVQFLLLRGDRIYLNARQKLLINTGFAVAVLAVGYFLLLVSPTPDGGVGTADLATVFLVGLLLSLVIASSAVIAINVVVPAFPQAAQVASKIAFKVNHIFLGGPA